MIGFVWGLCVLFRGFMGFHVGQPISRSLKYLQVNITCFETSTLFSRLNSICRGTSLQGDAFSEICVFERS